MSSERLFGTNIRPACKYCEHAIQPVAEERLLCGRYGVVAREHKCRHFVYDPLMRTPQPPRPLEQFSHEDFAILNSDEVLHTED